MRLRGMIARLMQLARRWLEARGPYQSLAILAVPLMIVEPAKLAALAIFGEGHWLVGALVMLTAYALSICVIERIFRIVKPKLMTLGWFAKVWAWLTSARVKAMCLFTKQP
jgi:hypothetical protein